jgi:3,4-dihydroxy 2-butanone 4-phosphate synthase/GTP cyclohydrolase II
MAHQIDLLPAEAATHRRRTGRPFVTLSYAQSLDGCIAAQPGQPLALSGSQSLILTHKLRAAHDAILVGIGTVLADDPQLNVRLVAGDNPQPVVVDSRLRFPLNANLLQHPPLPWIATSRQTGESRQQALEIVGARVLCLPTNAKGQVDLAVLLEQLGDLGVNSLMVEGGAGVITSFLSERLVDYMILTIAPTLVGGLSAVNHLEQFDPAHLPRLSNPRSEWMGKDLILSGRLSWEAP